MVASGTWGYGTEYVDLVSVEDLGAVVTKTVTLKPRDGNPPPRIYETPSGMINAIGLQNIGVDAFIEEKVPYFEDKNTVLIASIAGHTIAEFAELARRMDEVPRIDAIELNLSCPNIDYGGHEHDDSTRPLEFAQDHQQLTAVVQAVKQATHKPIVAKLSPEVSDIARAGLVAQSAGADAISLINTFRALSIDLERRQSHLANLTGGLSGPAIRPIALRMVWEVAQAVDIPVIGMGGILTPEDALTFLICGASAIAVGTGNFTNPRAPLEITAGIEAYLERHGVDQVGQLIGTLKTTVDE